MLIYKRHPIARPNGQMNICEKIERVITAPHCTRKYELTKVHLFWFPKPVLQPFLTNIWLLKLQVPLQWCHNELDGVSNRRRLDSLLSSLFRRRSKGNPPVIDGFPSQRTSNAENDFIWWRHNEIMTLPFQCFYWAIGPIRQCNLGWANIGTTVRTLSQRRANLHCYLGCHKTTP